jgi:hypothetical protein
MLTLRMEWDLAGKRQMAEPPQELLSLLSLRPLHAASPLVVSSAHQCDLHVSSWVLEPL